MKPLRFFLIIITFLCAIFFAVQLKGDVLAESASCDDFEFIFARGSGQSMNDIDFRTFKSEIEAKIPKNEYNYDFYELGSIEGGYPAFSPGDPFSVLGVYISAGESYEFGDSVETGVRELVSRIRSESKKCKDKRFLLAGYSQGAIVIDKSLAYLDSAKISYTATFGDPKLYLPEGKKACSNTSLSSYRVYVPDCGVKEGILGGQNPYETGTFKNKRGAWCNNNDFMCGSNLNISDIWTGHTSYIRDTGYKKFASIASEIITKKEEIKPELETRYSDAPPRDVIVLYDFREQMGAYIPSNLPSIREDLKKKLSEMAAHGTRIAVYNVYSASNYRAYEEMIPFTNDNLSEKIDEMNERNSVWRSLLISGAADNTYLAIRDISKNAKWLDGRERNIYVIKNTTSSYEVSAGRVNYQDAAIAAKENNVKVSVLSNSGYENSKKLKTISEETGGEIIGKNYEKIILNQEKVDKKPKYFSKTFEINRDSELTLVIINDAVYGFSDKKKIVIKDLNENLENRIELLSFNNDGKANEREIYKFGKIVLKTPDSGALKI